MPELDMCSIILLELGMIAGGITGFGAAIKLYLRKHSIKQMPVLDDSESEEYCEDNDELVELSNKIPDKKVSFLETNCGFDGTEPEQIVRKNRTLEDDSYRIIKRRLDKTDK